MSADAARECQQQRVTFAVLHASLRPDVASRRALQLLSVIAPPDAMTMTIYLYTHPFDDAPQGATLLRLNALRSLRDELAALPGVRVSPVPQGADLEVVLTNVIATDDAPGALDREGGHRILVVRLSRSGERLDFVCSDGRGQSAERQAARRIRNWVAGEDFFSSMSAPTPAGNMRAIA